ncbi:MAG: sulfur carrier protein ThiS [Actinobacteria bacterium]|nr:sulfur carrier protein ThiS [Actinomycetota bacterium]
MRVVLNGEPRDAPEGATVADLVAAAGIEPDRSGIAVAVNGEVAPRSAWATTPVVDGSRIEILQAVAGG